MAKITSAMVMKHKPHPSFTLKLHSNIAILPYGLSDTSGSSGIGIIECF